MKFIMENWRSFQNDQIAEEEFKKILQETNCNAYGIDWDKLLIKAVENPKNDEAFDAVRKLFGKLVNKSKRKKADIRDGYGKITIINQSSTNLFDFRISKTGPAFDASRFSKGHPTFDKVYQKPDDFLPIYEEPFKLTSQPGEFPGDVPAGTQCTFHAPNLLYQICYRWFPEKYYSAPRQPREEWISSLSSKQEGSPGRYTTTQGNEPEPAAGLLMYKHLNLDVGFNITGGSQYGIGDYEQLIKDVEWVITIVNGEPAPGLSLDEERPIPYPTFKKLEIIDHRETDR